MFFASLRDIPRQRAQAVDRAAKDAGWSHLENMMNRKVGELSRGYKQRAWRRCFCITRRC